MVISLGKVFEPFIEQRPFCVMARGVLENLCNADKIDALCARTAEVQYTRALLFSSVVDLMGQVVLGVQPSVHAAYQAQAAQLGISDQAMDDKLRQVELRVSAELVRDAARQASPVSGALQAELPPLVPGYRAKILDGPPVVNGQFLAVEYPWCRDRSYELPKVQDVSGLVYQKGVPFR